MHFKIEENIPLPIGATVGKPSKYVDKLRQIEPGQSALFEGCSDKEMFQIRNTAWRLKRDEGYEAVTRKVAEGSVRVWRTK